MMMTSGVSCVIATAALGWSGCACVQESQAVGPPAYRETARSDAPELISGPTFYYRHLGDALASPGPVSARTTGGQTIRAPSDDGVARSVALRMLAGTGTGGYLGVETGAGLFDPRADFRNGAMVLDYEVVLGLERGIGPINLAAEIAAGGRTWFDDDAPADLNTTRGVVEPRVRASFWLIPWVTLGVVGGTSLVERGAWMAGIALGFYGDAFGGLR
jgi:hypothetical protein